MVAQRTPHYITPEEYLERECAADTKSEYHDGVIVAMAGASPEHNIITFALGLELGAQLKGGNCLGFAPDQRLHVPECNKYYYPDASVVCGTPEYQSIDGVRALLNPTLIIEVLSRSTERADRGEKFDCYRTLPSLTTYVLITQDSLRIESYTRLEDGTWRYDVAIGREGVLTLSKIGCVLRLEEVYANVTFPPAPIAE